MSTSMLHGEPAALPDRARDALERTFGLDLGGAHLHAGEHADAYAREQGADAVTEGEDVYFRTDTYRPETAPGLWLVAHEVAHVLQQSKLPSGWSPTQGARGSLERDANAAADRALGGVAASGSVPRLARPGEGASFVQRHASWEHRLLGDAATADLVAIATKQPQRTQILQKLLAFLNMWHTTPLQVTEQMIADCYPYIRTVRLDGTNLLVTYGELNTLPDYLAGPSMIFGQSQDIMLPILQAVRQEGYNQVQNLLGGSWFPAQFSGAVAINTGWGFADLLLETQALDNLTWDLGPNHTDHYTALVARNACHFAPYSWYRWNRSFQTACTLAAQAYTVSDPALKARLTYMAWINHGYADHFLQDSFAAGHLVNKTFVMQLFVEWAAGKWYVPVADWDMVQNMTYALQPGVAATGLYNLSQPGNVYDPQTAEEQPTLQARMDMCGIQPQGSFTQAQAYQNYLAFLNGTVVQAASGALHDYFNANSLWVSSVTDTTPYQIWGDDTLLNGGDGVRIASETAHTSQQAIIDLLTTGTTSISWLDIANRFPTQVRNAAGQMVPLQQWQWSDEIKNLAFDTLFPAVHYYILRLAKARIGYVSIDSPSAVARPAATAHALAS